MKFQESIELCITKRYADFEGMATRSEYWWFFLFNFIVNTVLSTISRPLGWIWVLAMLTPQLAVGARRLRDTGRSPWWLLIGLVPVVGVIVLIVFFVQEGKSPTTPT